MDYAHEIQRRVNSGEPLATTREWLISETAFWNRYYADLEPIEKLFLNDLTTNFVIFLKQKENPKTPYPDLVMEQVTRLQAQMSNDDEDVVIPVIGKLLKSIGAISDADLKEGGATQLQYLKAIGVAV
jgi:hypothetical protein